jgi:hypothetical protein
MKTREDYQGHYGLYSLSVELERITSKIIEGRVDKKTIERLQELNANLKALSKEWQLYSPKKQDSSALKPAVNPTFSRNRAKL